MSDRVAVLRSGLVMQVGTPSAIYDRPANRFVAEFIGEANFLPASCVTADASGAGFRIDAAPRDAAPVRVHDCAGFAPGARAVLVVRPERISVVAAEQALLHGAVRGTMYSGSDLMLHCALDDATGVRVRLAGAADAAALRGRVGLSFPQDAVRAFAA